MLVSYYTVTMLLCMPIIKSVCIIVQPRLVFWLQAHKLKFQKEFMDPPPNPKYALAPAM